MSAASRHVSDFLVPVDPDSAIIQAWGEFLRAAHKDVALQRTLISARHYVATNYEETFGSPLREEAVHDEARNLLAAIYLAVQKMDFHFRPTSRMTRQRLQLASSRIEDEFYKVLKSELQVRARRFPSFGQKLAEGRHSADVLAKLLQEENAQISNELAAPDGSVPGYLKMGVFEGALLVGTIIVLIHGAKTGKLDDPLAGTSEEEDEDE